MKDLVQTIGMNEPIDLFDRTIGYEEDIGLKIAKGLSAEEIKQATILYKIFNGLWGLCVVFGKPGAGKDLFGNILTWKMKRYFPWKRILRDERPKELYGKYAGLFNEQVIKDDLDNMRLIAKGKTLKENSLLLDKAADKWVTDKGEVLLKNSVLYLTEFWRYVYNREPHSPMNKTMGGIHKMKRHIDVLVLGTAQIESDLDKRTCKPFIDWRVDCYRLPDNPTSFGYAIQKVTYSAHRDVLDSIGKPFAMSFDAGKPRSYLGDGKIKLRYNYIAETEEERVILLVLKAGIDNYEKLVEIIESEGDMTEAEILETLKILRFNKRKRAISYPCFFDLYNSKSAPQMRTSLKVVD